MFESIMKVAAATVIGLALTVSGALAHGDHANAKKCCKTDAAQACAAGSTSAKACPSTSTAAATTPACCAKHAAGDKQECCTKHAAGQRQACCETGAAVSASAQACATGKASAGACCKAGGNGQLSSSMQNLMSKVEELRRRRAQ